MMWFTPKNKKAILALTAGLFLLLCFMTGCNDSAPPAKKTEVVKKRIEQTPRTTTVTDAEKPAPAAAESAVLQAKDVAAPVANSASVQPPAAAEEKAPAPLTGTVQAETAALPAEEMKEAAEQPADTQEISLKSSLLDETTSRYDPTGKVDPFAALFSKESNTNVSDDTKPKRPLTPLEKIDVSQLQLVAVLLAKSGNRAMVEDATGKPYILTPGTFVGMNSGVVANILKDRVVIEEKSKDFLGRETSSTRELKLQKPLGEE